MGLVLGLIVNVLAWLIYVLYGWGVWPAIMITVIITVGICPIIGYGHRKFAGVGNIDLRWYLLTVVISTALAIPYVGHLH